MSLRSISAEPASLRSVSYLCYFWLLSSSNVLREWLPIPFETSVVICGYCCGSVTVKGLRTGISAERLECHRYIVWTMCLVPSPGMKFAACWTPWSEERSGDGGTTPFCFFWLLTDCARIRSQSLRWMILTEARTASGSGTQGRARDSLSSGRVVAEALIDYLKRGRPETPDRHLFFRVVAPISAATVSSSVALYLHKAGVKVRGAGSHTLRHTCVQRLIDAEFPLKSIGDYVGHRSSKSTRVYTKFAIASLHEVAMGDG